MTSLTGVVAVAAGNDHSLALKSDGTVWAWGNNVEAQLGIGTSNGTQATPAQVPGLTDVSAVAAGQWHTLALKGDGSLVAWGRTKLAGSETIDDRAYEPDADHRDHQRHCRRGGEPSLGRAEERWHRVGLGREQLGPAWPGRRAGPPGADAGAGARVDHRDRGRQPLDGRCRDGWIGVELGQQRAYVLGDGTPTTRVSPEPIAGPA